MKRSTLLPLLFLSFLFACSTGGGQTSSPVTQSGQARITVQIIPNPIQAHQVSGNTYDFPFTVSIREENGLAVSVDRVQLDVKALGAIRLYDQTYGPDDIKRLGYPTAIPARGDLRYSFNPRKEVPDERLFGGVSAVVNVDGTDANGHHVTAQTTVTISR